MTARLPEHFPLQQGLKLSSVADQGYVVALPEHFPLQQGLKPHDLSAVDGHIELPEHFPLQQGLKPTRPIFCLSPERFLSTFHYNKD